MANKISSSSSSSVCSCVGLGLGIGFREWVPIRNIIGGAAGGKHPLRSNGIFDVTTSSHFGLILQILVPLRPSRLSMAETAIRGRSHHGSDLSESTFIVSLIPRLDVFRPKIDYSVGGRSSRRGGPKWLLVNRRLLYPASARDAGMSRKKTNLLRKMAI